MGCMIEINERIAISAAELEVRASRSAGPGGQNVNKVNSRVMVLLDVGNCSSFSAEQKRRILTRLATRANKAGVVRVVSQRHRTQQANRRAAIGRLAELLKGALERAPARKTTKLPRRATEQRLKEKKQRSVLKQQRKSVGLNHQG